jgi:hypothetical protein
LRHCIALSAEETAPDGERPLTAKSIKRMRKAARGLRRLGLEIALKKGGVCHIEIDSLPPRNPGTLRALLAPKQLRFLGTRGAKS